MHPPHWSGRRRRHGAAHNADRGRERKAEDEEQDRDRAAVTELDPLKAAVDEIGRHRGRGADGAAQGHDPDQLEELERADHGQKNPDADGRGEQRQGDVSRHLPSVSAVDESGLADLLRRALQAREKEDDAKADVLPGGDAKHRPHHDIGVGEPELDETAETNGGQQGVKAAPGLEEQQPDHGGDGFGENVGDEDEEPQEGAAVDAAVEQQRDGEAQRQLDDDRQGGDEEVVEDAAREHRVREDADVVVEADEVVDGCKAVPLEEAVVGGRDQRHEDEQHKQRERGTDE